MSWSFRILFLYLGFVALILTLVFRCFGHTTELEYKDYYARELKFQDQIDAVNNTTLLDSPITHKVEGRGIQISLPTLLLTTDFIGEAIMMRPSDSSLDKTLELRPDPSGNCMISDKDFRKGVYKMKILISSKGKNYFKEAVVNLK